MPANRCRRSALTLFVAPLAGPATGCGATEPSAAAWCAEHVAGASRLASAFEGEEPDSAREFWVLVTDMHEDTADLWEAAEGVAPQEVLAPTREMVRAVRDFANRVRSLRPTDEEISAAVVTADSVEAALVALGVDLASANTDSLGDAAEAMQLYARKHCAG